MRLLTDLPNAVEDISIWEDADVQIWGEDVMESSDFLISEESVWHPHFAGICQGEVADSF